MSLQSIMDGIDAVSLKSWKLRRHQATTEGVKEPKSLLNSCGAAKRPARLARDQRGRRETTVSRHVRSRRLCPSRRSRVRATSRRIMPPSRKSCNQAETSLTQSSDRRCAIYGRHPRSDGLGCLYGWSWRMILTTPDGAHAAPQRVADTRITTLLLLLTPLIGNCL